MFNFCSVAKCKMPAISIAVAVVLAGTQMFAAPVQAAENHSVESGYVNTEHDSAHLVGHHHYRSSAERANDALLITEVKSALADDGVADGSAIVVDCDHGRILLSGVMRSARDARRAGHIAAAAPGVLAVKNQLTWH
jgi:osmotically-inducible protein OsmY